ncbi:hypothetical protein VPNG_00165 [Cytospora leucostoma]|uniref:DUF8004 domain-containing protein n=1 Tax=Cytospora leucostoma TaxID=1230097 RepID=A0A423XPE8_9PEZI|nr:hypothetical protein VPNG_00165 [Cytospora leucostoma]
MPSSKSSHSSKDKDRRPSMLSLPSVTNLLSASHEKDKDKDSPKAASSNIELSKAKASSSNIDLSKNKAPSPDDSPTSSSHHHGSISTVDNSSGVVMHTPATQDSDFDFGFRRTESPEAAGSGATGMAGTSKAAVIQKQQKGSSSQYPPPQSAPPQHLPPLPPKISVPQGPPSVEITETPTSPALPRSRGGERGSPSQPPRSPRTPRSPRSPETKGATNKTPPEKKSPPEKRGSPGRKDAAEKKKAPEKKNVLEKNASDKKDAADKKDAHAKLKSSKRPPSPKSEPHQRSVSAQPLSNDKLLVDDSQALSVPTDPNVYPRPMSKHSSDGESRGRVRKSWLPGGGGRSSSSSKELKKMSASKAWILAAENQADYNTYFLTNGEKVPELWNESGNVLVYLSPKGSGKGPSFKVPSPSIEASIVFHELIQEELESSSSRDIARSFDGRDSLMVQDAEPATPQSGTLELAPGEVRLYIPPATPEQSGAQKDGKGDPQLQRAIAIRNLFAFLTGQPLVGTKFHPTMFSAFLEISNLLKEFDFMSMDGATWGEAVDMSFGFYMAQLSLADVRHGREKTLEAVILGERMKCWELYNEAFTHAVGKWQALVSLKSPLIKQISPEVLRRLERSSLDLLNRQHNLNNRLEDFEFPALFSGVAASSEFRDVVRFGRWKSSFSRMRSFTHGYYKTMFGSWPPKARSKKNPFSESGLNRLVLKALYSDLSALYDLLVDRESLTPRVIDQAVDDVSDKEVDTHIKALRKLLTEFDQSSPPVLPPIPFDVPKLPAMKSVLANYDEMKEKEQAKFDRNLKENELQLVMHMSYNFDTDNVKSPFLKQFKEFDIEHAKGKTQAEIIDNRFGNWLFLYVVIQSLPLLVIDAPDLAFTDGVEYFLCQPPLGNPPWVEEAGEVRKAWYQLPGSQVRVELSTDVVMFSVEATYERSHCWEAAKRWDEAKQNGETAGLLGMPQPPPATEMIPPLSPLQAPRAVFEDNDPVIGHGAGTSGNFGNSGSPASSLPGSPISGPPRRVHSPSSGLALGRGSGSNYRASFVGLSALEPLPPPIGAAPVDRRSSRVFSAQMAHRQDSLGGSRPQSIAGSGSDSIRYARSVSNLRGESPTSATSGGLENINEGGSGSTFDDILKDMTNQKKPVKEKKKFF